MKLPTQQKTCILSDVQCILEYRDDHIMLLVSAVLILNVALIPLTDAATTYNLALLQETLEVLGEDIVMFITNKLNGGGNTENDNESLYETADDQPEGIDDEEDDEQEDNSSGDGEDATSKPEVEGAQHGRKTIEKEHQAGSKQKPKTEGKKKYVTVIEKSKEPSTKTIKDAHAKEVKAYLNETDDEEDSENRTEETGENDDEEEEEPDMAETMASVAVNVAAQKFNEHLGKLNIQLK